MILQMSLVGTKYVTALPHSTITLDSPIISIFVTFWYILLMLHFISILSPGFNISSKQNNPFFHFILPHPINVRYKYSLTAIIGHMFNFGEREKVTHTSSSIQNYTVKNLLPMSEYCNWNLVNAMLTTAKNPNRPGPRWRYPITYPAIFDFTRPFFNYHSVSGL